MESMSITNTLFAEQSDLMYVPVGLVVQLLHADGLLQDLPLKGVTAELQVTDS